MYKSKMFAIVIVFLYAGALFAQWSTADLDAPAWGAECSSAPTFTGEVLVQGGSAYLYIVIMPPVSSTVPYDVYWESEHLAFPLGLNNFNVPMSSSDWNSLPAGEYSWAVVEHRVLMDRIISENRHLIKTSGADEKHLTVSLYSSAPPSEFTQLKVNGTWEDYPYHTTANYGTHFTIEAEEEVSCYGITFRFFMWMNSSGLPASFDRVFSFDLEGNYHFLPFYLLTGNKDLTVRAMVNGDDSILNV